MASDGVDGEERSDCADPSATETVIEFQMVSVGADAGSDLDPEGDFEIHMVSEGVGDCCKLAMECSVYNKFVVAAEIHVIEEADFNVEVIDSTAVRVSGELQDEASELESTTIDADDSNYEKSIGSEICDEVKIDRSFIKEPNLVQAFNQICITLLDGTTRCLQFTSPTVSSDVLKRHLSSLTGIPASVQRLVTGSLNIQDDTPLSASVGFFPSCTLLLHLRAGKGGFHGIGQKKINNFDACYNLSSRRFRHINAEKMMEEWEAKTEDRKLEKLTEQFLRKKAKGVKKSSPVNVGTDEGSVDVGRDEKPVVLDDGSKEVGGLQGLPVYLLGKSLVGVGA